VEVVDYAPEYAAAFEALNLEWLEKYFQVEEVDQIVLSDPQVEVIDRGGHILFVKVAGEVVGTVALKHQGAGRYELTKMAVTAGQQGQGLGRALLVAAIERFHSISGGILSLETNSSLGTAIRLYESAGFRHASHPGGSDYARADTYMIYQPDDKVLKSKEKEE
jgi:ribosomal protein S18 acetylase RimI-like enzyme